ncbi:MAG: hypothetical protein HC837_00785 [Chloroflexaceae bacterium]|nr:hypothetical protein [Chloroflexaceae bacterium]
MSQQVPFIGRDAELALIDQLVQEGDTRRAIFIDAPGGLGKTRLLQEVNQRYRAGLSAAPTLIVADIIDFDDRTLHIAQNVGRTIAQMLDKRLFEPYLRGLSIYGVWKWPA